MIVAAVSYLNTIPFVWGIQQAAISLREGCSLDLELKVPSLCAEAYLNKSVDVALVPTAVIPLLREGVLITDYCISAEGAVETVALLSDADLCDIKTIYLDCDSRTSVELVKILAREKWHINPNWINGIPSKINPDEGVLAIGDKVFRIENQFAKKIDLACEWLEMTGLPFVFAAWVAVTEEGIKCKDVLNDALRLGVENIDMAIETLATGNSRAKKYLTENIKFNMSDQKMESMRLFWQHINPG